MKPQPTPETAPYWEAARAGELRVQRCLDCGRHYFYPRPECRFCASRNVEWTGVSGRARLVSYVINHRPFPGFENVSPVIAVVELDEGPRLMTNIVGTPAEEVQIGDRVRVTFQPVSDDAALPLFELDR